MHEDRRDKNLRRRLTSWVDGEREPKDQTLFVMEQRPPRRARQTEEEFERKDRDRLQKFFNWYPAAAAVICLVIVAVLLIAVMNMPGFGQADNPINNEVSDRYLKHGREETGSENAVTAMIVGYRGFDTFGESCVLFLAVAAVMILLAREEHRPADADTEEPEEERADLILEQAARPLIPFMLLIAAYMLLHSETTPGGGFSGGTLLGAGLILTSAAFGAESAQRLLSRRQYSAVRTFGLLAYGLLYGAYIFIGANGLQNHLTRLFLLLDLAVGLVVACTIYGFYALFSRGRI